MAIPIPGAKPVDTVSQQSTDGDDAAYRAGAADSLIAFGSSRAADPPQVRRCAVSTASTDAK